MFLMNAVRLTVEPFNAVRVTAPTLLWFKTILQTPCLQNSISTFSEVSNCPGWWHLLERNKEGPTWVLVLLCIPVALGCCWLGQSLFPAWEVTKTPHLQVLEQIRCKSAAPPFPFLPALAAEPGLWKLRESLSYNCMRHLKLTFISLTGTSPHLEQFSICLYFQVESRIRADMHLAAWLPLIWVANPQTATKPDRVMYHYYYTCWISFSFQNYFLYGTLILFLYRIPFNCPLF